jgi:polyisoprenyl-teichoic acid--peptidoglycan teichoic acid transferase
MRGREAKLHSRDRQAARSHPDRMTRLLIGATALLVMLALAIGLDILFRPLPGSQTARATASQRMETPTVPPSALIPPDTDIPMPAPTDVITVTPPACTAPQDWGLHVVEPDDTLYSMAQHYGTDVESLQRANCLETTTILVGQPLRVPGGAPLPEAFAAPTPHPGSEAEPSAPPAASNSESFTPSEPVEEPAALKINIPDSYLHILLLGVDRRPDGKKKVGYRADSIIVVSVDTTGPSVRLLHVPRDLWAYIPGHGYDRINSAYFWAELEEPGTGSQLMKQTVYYNLGIPIHYYAEADFQGFINIIDALGGLDIYVDCPLVDMELEPGLYHMDGLQTIRYATVRHSTSDFDRGLRQRKVLMALWEQGLNREIIARIPQLWTALSGNFRSDMPLGQVTNLASLGLQLSHDQIWQKAIGSRYVADWITPLGAWVLLPRQDSIRQLLEDHYAPKAPRQSATSKARVEILNGSSRPDAEKLAKDALKWEGFPLSTTGLAGYQDHTHSQILVLRGDPLHGFQVAQHLHLPAKAVQDLTAIPEPPDPSNRIDIRVILGQDYDPCGR